MNVFKELLYYLIGRVPAELHENEIKGKRLLHISDTPDSFFDELSRLIKILQPDYIIHTGDLVDNIKLEIYPGSVDRYRQQVKKLITQLEASSAQGIYMVMGNHDNLEEVQKLCSRSHILAEAKIVNIEGTTFALAHNAAQLPGLPAPFCLFGHNLKQKSGYADGRVFLNGISNIHLIELESLQYYSYPYPAGTDNDRLGKGKIGL
jgi:predicted MPP superfamily phosphohydrolase